jgi:hypothetical protein
MPLSCDVHGVTLLARPLFSRELSAGGVDFGLISDNDVVRDPVRLIV